MLKENRGHKFVAISHQVDDLQAFRVLHLKWSDFPINLKENKRFINSLSCLFTLTKAKEYQLPGGGKGGNPLRVLRKF